MKILNITSTLAAFVAAFLIAAYAQASTVRGQILRGGRPAPGIAVVITNGAVRSTPAFTGQDGMFYLMNVAPGRWTLEVWANGPNQQPLKFNITVVNAPFTDLPVLRL